MSPSARRNFMQRITLTIAIALGLSAGLAIGASGSVLADGIAVGSRAPEFDIAKDSKGRKFHLKSRAGKWTVVTFGAKWCVPCAKELPQWEKLAKSYSGRVEFLAVNINNDPKDGVKFFDSLKIKKMTRVFLPAKSSAVDDAYETGTFPSTFVIDPRGIVRHVHRGYRDGDAAGLRTAIDKLTKSK